MSVVGLAFNEMRAQVMESTETRRRDAGRTKQAEATLDEIAILATIQVAQELNEIKHALMDIARSMT